MPVVRRHVSFESLKYREIFFETDFHCSYLSNHSVGVDSCTPETTLRAFDAKELAVEDDSCFHARLPTTLSAARIIGLGGSGNDWWVGAIWPSEVPA